VPGIRKTSDLVQEISAASSEQSAGVAQINTAMGQLNHVTQENASASDDLSATADEMIEQAGQLQKLMEYFKLEAATGTAAVKGATMGTKPAGGSKGGLKPAGIAKPGNGPASAKPASSAARARGTAVDESQFERF
jgi:methyl-accepting chemotaxis protein